MILRNKISVEGKFCEEFVTEFDISPKAMMAVPCSTNNTGLIFINKFIRGRIILNQYYESLDHKLYYRAFSTMSGDSTSISKSRQDS